MKINADNKLSKEENHTPEKRLEEKEKEHEVTQLKNGIKIGEVEAIYEKRERQNQEEDIIIKQ